MAEGGNKYWVIIQAALEKIKQSQVEDAFKNTKPVTIDVTIANKNAKEQIAQIESQLGTAGDKFKTQAIFKSDELTKYSAEVTHIASGVQTVSKYIVDVNKEGERTTTLVDSISTQTSKLSLTEQQNLGIYKEKTKALQLQEAEINRVKNIEQKRQIEEYNKNAKLKALTEQRQLDEYNAAGKIAARQKAINEKRQKEEYDLNAKLKALMEKRQKEEYDNIAKSVRQQEKLTESANIYQKRLDDIKITHKDAFKSEDVQNLAGETQTLINTTRAGTDVTKELKNSYGKLDTEIKKVEQGFNTAREKTDNFTTALIKNIGKVVQWALATGAIYGTLREFKEGVQYIKDLNTELTNIGLVTGQSASELAGMANEFNSMAQELGSSTLEVAKGATEWIRQGRSMSDTMLLLKNSTMLAKLGNIDSADATSKLTATINAYNISAKDSIGIVDTLVSLDNSLAASTEGIANGMQKASSMAKQAGVSYQNLAAYVGVLISRTQQSGDTIGQALKTIFARMESVKAGASVDEEGEAINDVEKVLIANGIRLRDGLNTFRDMDTVLSEVAVKYKELGEAGNTVAQGQILTAIAGQRQINIVASLLDGWNDVVKAQETASSSAGIAKSRYEIFLDSVNASMNKFKTSWEAVWQGTVNSGTIKLLYDIGAAIGNILSKTGGLIPSMMALTSILISVKKEQIAKVFGDVAKSFTILKEAIAAGQLKTSLANIFTSALSAIPMVIAGVLTLVGVIGSLYTAIKDVYDLNKKADKAAEDLAKVSSELEELESKKNRIKSLKEEFDELTKSTDKSAESQKRLNEIQNELKTLLPDLKGKVDELGNYQIDQSSLDSNVAYNKLLQERINLKREESQLSAAKSIKADAKAYEDNLKNINDLNKAIEDSYYWQNKLSESQNYFDVEKALTFILSPEEIESYQSQINEYKDTNLEYLQNTIDSMSILTEEQKSKLKEQLQSFDDFNIALGKYWTDIKEEIEEKPIVPQISYEKLKESADATYDAAQKAVNGVESLLSSLKDGDVLGIDQISSLKDLFPADAINGVNNYTKAISIQNGQIKLNVNGLKELLVAKMESAVASAKEAATTAQAEYAKASAALGATKAIINAKAQEIYIAKALGEAVSAEAYTTLRAAKLKIASEEAVLKAKGIALTRANTDLSIAEALLAQVQSQTYWNGALAESIGDVGSAQNETNKALEAYNDLLDMTIKMLKQRKQDEIDALEEELDNYKKIIDAQKEKLDREKEEADYQKDLADKNKILSDIENELLQLQFDNSEEAKKRRLELEEERAEATEDIDETQADRSYDIQKKALDDEYDSYEETMEKRIDTLKEYLEQEGSIRSEAIDLLQAKTDSFYQSLIAWNRLYGSGIDSDIIDKWAIASNSVNEYAYTAGAALSGVGKAADSAAAKIQSALSAYNTYDFVTATKSYGEKAELDKQIAALKLKAGQAAGTTSMIRIYHDGGVVGGNLPKIKESEEYAKLLKGEVVTTESQMKNFINNTLPNLTNTLAGSTNIGDINLSFNVAGSLDKSVLPEIKDVVSNTLMNIIKNKGIMRNASSFSV